MPIRSPPKAAAASRAARHDETTALVPATGSAADFLPGEREIAACRPWLDAELEAVRPQVLVCLGATAAQALFGKRFRVSTQRGQPLNTPLAPRALATVHPASILRRPGSEERERALAELVAGLRVAAGCLDRRR